MRHVRLQHAELQHADVPLALSFNATPVTDHSSRASRDMPMCVPRFLAVCIPLAFVAGAVRADAPAAQRDRFEIAITRNGFEPGSITVAAKTPVVLVFTRKTDATCTKSIVVTLDDGKTIERELPLDKPVEIAATFAKAGKLDYACSMHMNKGTIVVQ